MADVWLSVAIVTFNSKNLIETCLSSVFNQDFRNLEVIIVDNGSVDGTVNFIRERYPWVILIENEKNLGVCKARNQAIEISRGIWILTLDCDVVLENNFLQNIRSYTDNLSPGIGALQPKILKPDKKTIHSCGIYLSKPLRRFHDLGQGKRDSGQFDKSRYIFGLCAAAALYNRGMLRELKESTGYFDERFFFLVEDVDLSWRLQNKGWKAMFAPQAVCYHSGNSSNCDKKTRQFLCFRNRYYSIMKNEGLKKYFGKIFPLFLYDFPRLLYLIFTNRYIYKRLEMAGNPR
jgi:hypothetical protein